MINMWVVLCRCIRDVFSNTIQMSEFNVAVEKVETAGAIVTLNVTLRKISVEDHKLINSIACVYLSRVSTTKGVVVSQDLPHPLNYATGHDYARGFEMFTSGLIDPPVRTLQELVEFNKKHASQAMQEGRQSSE
jgi:hypothetical protein